MKKAIIVFSILIMSGCTGGQKVVNDSFTATILPVKFIVDRITGNGIPVSVLVPPGSSPETYEPTAKQIVDVEKSKLLFSTHLIDFEQALKKNPLIVDKSVDLSAGIELIEGSCSNHGDHHHHGIDPHIWTSPKELIKMSDNAYKAIAAAYPDSTHYHKNYTELTEELALLDSFIQGKRDASNIKYFIIYHPALTYYSKEYNIEQISLEDEGKEPSAERLKAIIDKAKCDGITRIFYQREFGKSSVDAVAKEIGAIPVEIDPLSGDVINNLHHITELIFQ